MSLINILYNIVNENMKYQEKLICIKIPNPIGDDVYERITISEAMRRMKENPKIRYTSKSAYKKYMKNR